MFVCVGPAVSHPDEQNGWMAKNESFETYQSDCNVSSKLSGPDDKILTRKTRANFLSQ